LKQYNNILSTVNGSNYDQVSAIKLSPLWTQLPFTGTLSVIPFS